MKNTVIKNGEKSFKQMPNYLKTCQYALKNINKMQFHIKKCPKNN